MCESHWDNDNKNKPPNKLWPESTFNIQQQESMWYSKIKPAQHYRVSAKPSSQPNTIVQQIVILSKADSDKHFTATLQKEYKDLRARVPKSSSFSIDSKASEH